MDGQSRIGPSLSPEGAKRSEAAPKALENDVPMWPPEVVRTPQPLCAELAADECFAPASG